MFRIEVNNLTICHFIFIARQLFQHVPQQANGCVLPRFNDEVLGYGIYQFSYYRNLVLLGNKFQELR